MGNKLKFYFLTFILVLSLAPITTAGPAETIQNLFNISEFNFNTIIAWFFVILIILFVYSALTFGSFPKNGILRWVLTLAIGIPASLFIVPVNISSFTIQYSPLFATMFLLIPIIALSFFTTAVSASGSSIGILLQRLLWGVYSIFLIHQSLYGLILRWNKTAVAESSFFIVRAINWVIGTDGSGPSAKILSYLGFTSVAGEPSTTILITLLISSVAVLWIFVIKNQATADWLEEQKEKSTILRFQDTKSRAEAVDDIHAQQTRTS